MMEDKFQKEDRVFAKIKGWPPWPAKILSKAEGKVEAYKCLFYGTYDTSVVKPDKIHLYNDENRVIYGKKKSNHRWKEAMDEIVKNTPICENGPIEEEQAKEEAIAEMEEDTDDDGERIVKGPPPLMPKPRGLIPPLNGKLEVQSERQSKGHFKSSMKVRIYSPEVARLDRNHPSIKRQGAESGSCYDFVSDDETTALESESPVNFIDKCSSFAKSANTFLKDVQDEQQKLLKKRKKDQDKSDGLKLRLSSAEKEIAKLKKALEEKTEALSTSRHFLELEKKLSEKTKSELASTQGKCDRMKEDIRDLQDKCETSSKLLQDGRMEIEDLKRKNQNLNETISGQEAGIRRFEDMLNECDNNKRKLLDDMKQPLKKLKQNSDQ